MEEIEELEIKKEVLEKRLQKVREEIDEATKERNRRLAREYELKATHNVFKAGQFVKNKREEKPEIEVIEMLDKGYFIGRGFEYSWGRLEYRNHKYRSDDYEIIEDAFYYKNHTLQLELTPSEIIRLKQDLRGKHNFAAETYTKIHEWICKIQKEK